MKYDNILIDISNLYMRAYSVNQDLTVELEDGTKIISGGIFTGIKMINSIENKFLKENGKMYFLFDNCHSGINRRKEIDPDYKSNRTKKDDNFYRSLDIFHMILLNYKDNYYCVQKEGCEADDLVDALIKSFPLDEDTLLVSNDMDWFRSISDYCHVAKYEMREYVIYKPIDFLEKFGFESSVKNIVLYKAFRGDASDNIPIGVPEIREKDLVRLVVDYNNMTDLLNRISNNSYISPLFKNRILENASRLLLNEKLVSFQEISKDEILESIYPCKFNMKTLHSLYKSLDFKISKIDPRVATFFHKEEKPRETSSFFQFDKANRL